MILKRSLVLGTFVKLQYIMIQFLKVRIFYIRKTVQTADLLLFVDTLAYHFCDSIALLITI